MKTAFQSVRRFLAAEEVPRWFGLSIVLIYVVGLGTVANIGIHYAWNESSMQFQQSSRYALQQLADQLALIGHPGSSDPTMVNQYQQALRKFSTHIPVRIVRMVNGTRVIASTHTAEMGTDRQMESVAMVGMGFDHVRYSSDWWIRLAVPFHKLSDREKVLAGTNSAASPKPPDSVKDPHVSSTPVLLEAKFPPTSPAISSVPRTVGTLSIVLAVLGALFVVYRCLREQLRGISRIADRLQTHRERIEQELGSLHIANMVGFDHVIASWNELIDLTQRLQKQAQRTDATEELSRALQQTGSSALAEALNVVPDGMIYIADENRLEYVNATAGHLFGWESQQVKHTTLDSVSTGGIGENILTIIQKALQPDGSFQSCDELLHVDDPLGQFQGSYRILVIPMHRTHHQGECMVVIRDVSQQMRAECAREEFISQVSHELRTPLTNIRAYAETLSSGMFEDPKVITECYNVITKETCRLSRLVEDVLSVSQLDIGTIEISLDTVELNTLLNDCVRDIRGLADEKNIDLQLVLPAKMDTIKADRDKLAVVINNLLGNAIKYTPSDGNIIVGCQFTNNEVVLTFKDNGIGVDPDDHVRIFEKFQRGHGPEVQNEAGTGIGLYTAREIVRRHGGDIELISEKNEGSTFMVRLPHRESRAAAMTTREAD